jgi:hypothetical protein
MNKKQKGPAPSQPIGASKPVALTPEQLTMEIRKRAQEIFEKRGNKPGTALGDWLASEREIKAKHNIPA